MKKETLAQELKHLIHEYATLITHTSYRSDNISRIREKKLRIDEICDALITGAEAEKPDPVETKEWLK